MKALKQAVFAWMGRLRQARIARRIRQVRMCMQAEMRLHAQHMQLLEAELDALEGKRS